MENKEVKEVKESKVLTDDELANYCLLLEEAETFEERRDIILSILDNADIAVDKRLGKMLKSYKKEVVKIREQNKANMSPLVYSKRNNEI